LFILAVAARFGQQRVLFGVVVDLGAYLLAQVEVLLNGEDVESPSPFFCAR
jgi:hypothetical protein